MTNSSSTLNAWSNVSLTDLLTKSEDVNGVDKHVSNWIPKTSDSENERRYPFAAKGMMVTDTQHAFNRAGLRRLGRSKPNQTAEPEAQLTANHYHERASKLESRVREFLSCTADWDGDGAKEIPLSAVYASLNFIDEVKRHFPGMEPRSAAPSPDGEIALYWHSPNGYAEVNFDDSGKLSICWGDESDQMNFIEEENQNITGLDKNLVWKTLSDFLDQKYR
ncbi:MAG: hypothetical protein H6887_09630 [Hoeflea sp.]|nr:hypothetical protein [Hoeflea sp.]